MLRRLLLGVPLSLALAVPAWGQVSSVDLTNYQLTGTFALPSTEAAEASAVTYNWDTDTLFVLGDEGEYLAEVQKDGTLVGSMELTGFDDTEGLAYLGSGVFVLVEERIQDVFRLTYSAGTTVDRSTLAGVSLGDTVGNIGLEGIAYDLPTGNFLAVKEKTPQRVLQATLDFGAGTATSSELFVPSLGVDDLSDIQALSTVPSLAGTADADNLLIYSQETPRLLEVSRSRAILSEFDFSALADNAEGVTIDHDGVIYVVGETPALFVLSPVPEPATWVLLAAGIAALVLGRRRVAP